jgi:hypothetical protein
VAFERILISFSMSAGRADRIREQHERWPPPNASRRPRPVAGAQKIRGRAAIRSARPRAREAAEIAELLQQRLQPQHLLAHGAHGLGERGGEIGLLLVVRALQARDRDGDGRERVLDLVGDLASHLPVRGLALAGAQLVTVGAEVGAHAFERPYERPQSRTLSILRLVPLAARDPFEKSASVPDRRDSRATTRRPAHRQHQAEQAEHERRAQHGQRVVSVAVEASPTR